MWKGTAQNWYKNKQQQQTYIITNKNASKMIECDWGTLNNKIPPKKIYRLGNRERRYGHRVCTCNRDGIDRCHMWSNWRRTLPTKRNETKQNQAKPSQTRTDLWCICFRFIYWLNCIHLVTKRYNLFNTFCQFFCFFSFVWNSQCTTKDRMMAANTHIHTTNQFTIVYCMNDQ